MVAKAEPSEVGVLFTADNAFAIYNRRKTQTRRTIPDRCWRDLDPESAADREKLLERCSFGPPGRILWVREGWRTLAIHDHLDGKQLVENGWLAAGLPIFYVADESVTFKRGDRVEGTYPKWNGDAGSLGRYRHGRFMPKWASRMRLRVSALRCERPRDISQADAEAEGVRRDPLHFQWLGAPVGKGPERRSCESANAAFLDRWVHLHGDPASIDRYVFVIDFAYHATRHG